MNHGPAFKKLDNEIKRAVKAERDKGYYGDGKSTTPIQIVISNVFFPGLSGFYSSGIHLATGIAIESDPLMAGDAPEYICGGAADRYASSLPPFRRCLLLIQVIDRRRGRKRGLVEGVGGSGHWVLMSWGRLVRRRRRGGKLEGGFGVLW